MRGTSNPYVAHLETVGGQLEVSVDGMVPSTYSSMGEAGETEQDEPMNTNERLNIILDHLTKHDIPITRIHWVTNVSEARSSTGPFFKPKRALANAYPKGLQAVDTLDSLYIPWPDTDIHFVICLHELGHLFGAEDGGITSTEEGASNWAIEHAPYWTREMTRAVLGAVLTYVYSPIPDLRVPIEVADRLQAKALARENDQTR
jgi:hypothetical protein